MLASSGDRPDHAGRRAEFEELYVAAQGRLHAYLWRLTGSADVADDLLQDTFVRFLRSGFKGAGRHDEIRYLYRIASNVARDNWRRAKLRTSLNESEAGSAAELSSKVDMDAALSSLKPKERSLVWLAYVEGYSHSEIADVLNVEERSVRVLLFRAKSKLLDLFRRRAK